MKQLVLALLAAATVTSMVACSPAAKNNNASTGNKDAIIGGIDVVEGTVLQQSIVGIYDYNKGALCTGSLIRENVVLTAAHCIGANPQDHLIVFATDLIDTFKRAKTDPNYFAQKVRRGVKTIVNENWGKQHKDNEAWGDIALIKFGGTAPTGFKPATFISSSNLLAQGKIVTVAGYGVNSDTLVPVTPSNSPEFKKQLESGEVFCDNDDLTKAKCYHEEVGGEGKLRTTELPIEGNYNETEVVLNQTKGQASCEGDSGGPAYLKVNNQYQLWGVTSRGTRGCNGYVIYTDAAAQMTWINSKVTELGQ
jgi:secreted trypsin-like serine protease